ncbi:hypothetical protein B0H14DRAFT_2745326 [Mycena olivaceomarginata]|nr:hypothetical protein B0H14DRAFT_2745326 [Mycena olivaceomarginata]
MRNGSRSQLNCLPTSDNERSQHTQDRHMSLLNGLLLLSIALVLVIPFSDGEADWLFILILSTTLLAIFAWNSGCTCRYNG